MKFKYTILYVNDVLASLTFYEKAFGFERKMLHEGGDYGELDTGATLLAFSSLELMKSLGKSPGKSDANAPTFELAFETDDVEASLNRAIEAGATLVQGASEQPWGQTICYVTDQNGFMIEICSPVAT